MSASRMSVYPTGKVRVGFLMSTTKHEKCASYATLNVSDGVDLLVTLNDTASCSDAVVEEESTALHVSVTSFISSEDHGLVNDCWVVHSPKVSETDVVSSCQV